jgi:hypothetical protein
MNKATTTLTRAATSAACTLASATIEVPSKAASIACKSKSSSGKFSRKMRPHARFQPQ